MTYNADIHHRRSIRLKGYDYSSANAYFVTVCVEGRECLFGEIVDDAIRVNDAGRMVAEMWEGLPERFPHVTMNEFMVMPNHFHGIIIINNDVGALLAAPDLKSDRQGMGTKSNFGGPKNHINKGAASSAPTLGSVLRVFKSISAIGVNRLLHRQERPLWQRNYYERIIRDVIELATIRDYIRLNPVQWAQDKENPEKHDS